jgi:N utilization substance protein B
MKPRTRARALALQVLYEIDIATTHSPAEVLKARLEESPLSDELADFARQIVFGVFPIEHELDQLIAKYAPEWPLEQVAIVDRNILRIAIYELGAQVTTPVGVVIAEAVELAGLFGAEGTPRFVNGVLGALADDLDPIRRMFTPEPPDTGE